MAGAGGAGLGCQPLIPHRPGTHMNTWAPRERICMCTHTYTQAWHTPAHACAPYVQSLSHKPYEVTSTHIHAHMEMEKGRSRQGGAELGKGQLPQPLGQGEEGSSPLPRPQWWKLTQVSSLLIPKTPPGPLTWRLVKIHRHSQENYCPVWGKCLLCARHSASWRALTHCLFLTPTC